jgi:hypothetical protein
MLFKKNIFVLFIMRNVFIILFLGFYATISKEEELKIKNESKFKINLAR